LEFDGRNENDEKLTFEPKRVRLHRNPGTILSKNNKSPLPQRGIYQIRAPLLFKQDYYYEKNTASKTAVLKIYL